MACVPFQLLIISKEHLRSTSFTLRDNVKGGVTRCVIEGGVGGGRKNVPVDEDGSGNDGFDESQRVIIFTCHPLDCLVFIPQHNPPGLLTGQDTAYTPLV